MFSDETKLPEVIFWIKKPENKDTEQFQSLQDELQQLFEKHNPYVKRKIENSANFSLYQLTTLRYDCSKSLLPTKFFFNF